MKRSLLALSSVIAIAACSATINNIKHTTASRIARPAFMIERTIAEGPYALYAWERMRDRREKAVLYIEGDSDINPHALHLASRDTTRNVAYLAQPCQFNTDNSHNCGTDFHQPGGAEVIASYNAAMNEMKARYGITGFDIVGYGSGGNIAALLAAERDDILSLRTVAGKLNPKDGASATAIAPELADMPQHHFIGAADNEVHPDTYHFYRQAMGPSSCVHYTLVQDADHDRGWVDEWPELLKSPTACEAELMEDYDPEPFPPSKDYRLTK